MRLRTLLLFGALAFVPAAHATPAMAPSAICDASPQSPTLSQTGQSDASVAIPKVMARQAQAWNKGDLEGFMDGYARSADITYTAGGVVVTGWQPLMDRYRARYGSAPETMGTLRFENLRVTPLGKDAALCVGQWFLEPATAGSRPGSSPAQVSSEEAVAKGGQADARPRPRPMDGVFSLVWVRGEHGWRIVHDHSSLRVTK